MSIGYPTGMVVATEEFGSGTYRSVG